MQVAQRRSHSCSWINRAAPALTLALFAPLITEVLPGATRLSSIFVFPIEMCVWGGGALLIRYAVRRGGLKWRSLFLLAIALSVAEECLIQQTSLAPLVIQLKGIEYARACNVNYVYLLWALIYEPIFVVLIPVALVELIFEKRKNNAWLNTGGLIAATVFFLLGSFLAWFTWTRIARPKVFHLPPYLPPASQLIIAAIAIVSLVFLALGPPRKLLSRPIKARSAPAAWIVGTLGAAFAVLCYALVLLAFGIAPTLPPVFTVSVGSAMALVTLYVLPRWAASSQWSRLHTFCLVYGTVVAATLIGFLGFLQDLNADFWFKLMTNVIAIVLLMALGMKTAGQRQTIN